MQQFEEVRSILEKAKKITVLTGAVQVRKVVFQIFVQQMDCMLMRMWRCTYQEGTITEVRKNFGSIIKKSFKLIRSININQIVAIAFS